MMQMMRHPRHHFIGLRNWEKDCLPASNNTKLSRTMVVERGEVSVSNPSFSPHRWYIFFGDMLESCLR